MPQSFIKFYGNDWRADPRLRLCSAAARGVWIDLISIMMEAEPFGHLVVNGKAPPAAMLGILTVTPVKIVTAALAELEENGVFSKTDQGIIYSRRMVRDAERAAKGREHISKRWGNNGDQKADTDRSPSSVPSSVPNRSPNRSPSRDPITHAGAPSFQKPEARSQTVGAGMGYVPVGAIPWQASGPGQGVGDGAHVAWSFHALREVHFGTTPPPHISAHDISIAQGWIDNGASYEACRELMDERMKRIADRGEKLPGNLRFFDRAIGELSGRAA